MKTKLYLLWGLLLMLVGGVNDAWAETTYKLSLNGSAQESKNGGGYGATSFFTVTGNFNSKFNNATYDGISFTNGLKLESDKGTISFSIAGTATVTIVQSTLSDKGIKFDGTSYAYSSASTGTGYRTYTISDVSAGSHTISRGDGESGLFFVQVVQTSDLIAPTSSFAYGTDCMAVIPANENSTTINNTFTTNSDGTHTWTVTNAGATGATVDNNGNVTVSSTGTATIQVTTAATSTYATDTKTYTLTVKKAEEYTIDVTKLKIPTNINASRNINRTIPRMDISFGGGDGVKFNNADAFIFRYNGSVTLSLRKSEDEAQITKIVLVGDFSQYDVSNQELSHYIQANEGTLEKTDDSHLTWTGYSDAVTFSSQNNGSVTISDITFTTNGYALDASKVTPSFSFSPISQQALASSSQNYNATLTSTPGFITGDIVFDAGGTGTTQGGTSYTSGTSNTVYTLTSGSISGTATLTASYTAGGDDYFNSSEASATYSLVVGASLSELPIFAFNYQEVLYQGASGNKYVNCANDWEVNDATNFSFVYDPSYTTLKTKVNLGTTTIASIGAEANSTYFTVDSSDPSVLDVSEVSLQSASNGTRLYFNGIKVLKAGTVNLTYRFLGSATHAATSTTVAFTVVEPLTIYNGSYPFTWDFSGNSTGRWNSSKLQMGYQGSSWEKDNNSAKLSTYTYVPDWNDVDVIKRLAITPSGSNDEEKKSHLYLNWGADKIWLNGTITIPNVSPDYVVTISGTNYDSGDITATIGGTAQTITEESGTWTCAPNATGNLVITFPNTDITSIAVNRRAYISTYTTTKSATEIDGKIRDVSGTFTFTGAGTITGGTQIKDVPGIVMTVGKSGTTHPWTVKDDGSGTICLTVDETGKRVIRDSDHNWIPTDGCYLKFSPYVNGYLTLNGHLYGGTGNDNKGVFMYGNDAIAEGNSNGISLDGREMEIWTSDQTERTIGEPLLAGRTYYVYCLKNPLQLHSFTFRPAFLTVDDNGNFTKNESNVITSTEPSKTDADGSRYEAGLSKNDWAFPKLITKAAGQGLAKFAGDRTIVNLAANNDVDLLAKGQTIIKGTVLCNDNDHELFTYYYLESKVLSVTGTTLGGSTIADQDYVDQTGAASYPYVFTFNENIEKINDNFHVYVQIDGGNRIDFAGTPTWYTVSGNTLSVNFTAIGDASTALADGSTYRIVIPAGALQKSGDGTIQNSEIVRTFSLNGDLEAPIKMIYPTGIASVGTSIVLETYVFNGSESIGISDSHKVKARLKRTDGTGEEMIIDAVFSGNRLIFKPTSTLDPNTEYTLRVLANETGVTGGQIFMKDFTKDKVTYVYKVTKDKAFYFTTGATAGTVPSPTAYFPANDPEGNVPVTAYSSGRISFTFDQNVELEPYSTVYATPINGDEATVSKEIMLSASDSDTKLFVDESGKTVYFDYVSDDLKYDLYYEVLMPVNTVVGAGGKPNDQPVKFRFRMAKNPNATPVDASSFYPHSWDFNKFGASATSTTSAYILAANVGDENKNPKYKVLNALQKSDQDFSTDDKKNDENYDYRSFSSSGYGFDQGNDVYIATSATSTYKLPEFEGIRVSLAKSLNNRFAIRHTTEKNVDGTDKYVFRMNGNTHYLALSNVPAGKLYMVVNCVHLGINSPNATIESVSGDGYELTNNNTLLNTNTSTRKVVINVQEAGDVTFCVQNFNCEKIGVAEDEKTFKPGFAESGKTYATDRLTYDVRYDLLNAFTDHIVKAYYVTGITDNTEDNTATINAKEVAYSVAGADEGVILLYQAGVAADTNVPVFKADVNSAEQSGQTNELKVIESNTTTVPTPADDCYMYVLSNKGSKSDGVAFYRYTGNTFSDRAAYLEVPKYMVNPSISGGSARVFRMVFYNEDGSETTVIRTVEKDGVTEKAEQAGGYYDLRGQRLAKPNKRGLYIKNGKKVYVK